MRRHRGEDGEEERRGGREGQQVEGADKTYERRGRIRQRKGSYADGEAGRGWAG